MAANFSSSPGRSPRPSDGRGVRGEGKGERGENGPIILIGAHWTLDQCKLLPTSEERKKVSVLNIATIRFPADHFHLGHCLDSKFDTRVQARSCKSPAIHFRIIV